MKALVIHAARDLRIEDRETEQPGPGEVAVKLAAGGICGSDLHYYNHGGFGAVRLKEPMILGHEVAGHVSALGSGVSGLAVGDLVSVSPSRPCGHCQYCQRSMQNHCMNMRFYGSAMPFPHIQGAFRELLVARAEQCVKADGLTPGEAAMAEPLSVCLHATRRAGEVFGKRVLVTGSGPIGTLCVLAARAAGAAEITVTDLSDSALAFARKVGADRALNTASDPMALAPFQAGKGYFDVMFECSGAAPALAGAIPAMQPRSIIMQLGLGGDMTLPMQAMTAREIELRGSFRFHEEFATAVALMRAGRIDVKPLISHTMKMTDSKAAFELAGDRSLAMKVHLAFG
jgi:L-idonate 5-dehydrogenase